jgi:hypothetical protein
MEIVSKDIYIRLSPGIRLRQEFFGGLVFDPHTGTILEVDKDAFLLLKKSDGNRHRCKHLS